MRSPGVRLVGYIAASLDGRITDASGGVRWLDAFAAEEHGYAEFYAGIHALVMGRGTYEAIRGLADWPYRGKPALVLTRQPLADAPAGVDHHSGGFAGLGERLAELGARQAWLVGGGRAIAGALAAGLLDRLSLFTMPVVLGAGTLLFGEGPERSATLVGSRVWPSGAVESTYDFTERAWT
jgi:dihydrofolate reductase